MKKTAILSLVLSVLAVFISCCTAFGYDIDGGDMSFILGTFALLVTLLVAWNIWSAIDINGSQKEQEARFTDIQQKFNYIQNCADYNSALMYGRTSQMIACSLSNIGKIELKKDMLRSAIVSVKMFANLSAETEYNSILKTTLQAMKATDKVPLSEADIDNFLLMIGEIKQRENIPLIDHLVLAIRRCKEKDVEQTYCR